MRNFEAKVNNREKRLNDRHIARHNKIEVNLLCTNKSQVYLMK